jgi:hypothetical protein
MLTYNSPPKTSFGIGQRTCDRLEPQKPCPRHASANETYAPTAFILYMNGIVEERAELKEKTLPQIKLPNRDGFVPDPRPDVPSTQPKK